MAFTIPDFFFSEPILRNNEPGTMFVLCNKLNKEQLKRVRRRETIVATTAQYKYAPEQVYDALWVSDKARDVYYA